MPKVTYKEIVIPEKGKQLCILIDVKEVENKYFNPQQDKEDKAKRLDWLFAYEQNPEMRIHIWTSTSMIIYKSKKSNVLKLIEALMDKEFSSAEIKDGIADTSTLLGKKIYLQVKHEKDEEGGIRAKVTDYQGLSGDSF